MAIPFRKILILYLTSFRLCSQQQRLGFGICPWRVVMIAWMRAWVWMRVTLLVVDWRRCIKIFKRSYRVASKSWLLGLVRKTIWIDWVQAMGLWSLKICFISTAAVYWLVNLLELFLLWTHFWLLSMMVFGVCLFMAGTLIMLVLLFSTPLCALLVVPLDAVMIQNIELVFLVVHHEGECRFYITTNRIFHTFDFMTIVNTLLIAIQWTYEVIRKVCFLPICFVFPDSFQQSVDRLIELLAVLLNFTESVLYAEPQLFA